MSPPPGPRIISEEAGRKLFLCSRGQMFTESSKGMEERGPLRKIRIVFLCAN